MLVSLGFIVFFSLLSGTCMYISRVRGNAYRKKFARVVLRKEMEQEKQKMTVGVSEINLTVRLIPTTNFDLIPNLIQQIKTNDAVLIDYNGNPIGAISTCLAF